MYNYIIPIINIFKLIMKYLLCFFFQNIYIYPSSINFPGVYYKSINIELHLKDNSIKLMDTTTFIKIYWKDNLK